MKALNIFAAVVVMALAVVLVGDMVGAPATVPKPPEAIQPPQLVIPTDAELAVQLVQYRQKIEFLVLFERALETIDEAISQQDVRGTVEVEKAKSKVATLKAAVNEAVGRTYAGTDLSVLPALRKAQTAAEEALKATSEAMEEEMSVLQAGKARLEKEQKAMLKEVKSLEKSMAERQKEVLAQKTP